MNLTTTLELVALVMTGRGIEIDYENRIWVVTQVHIGFGRTRISVFPNDLGRNHAGIGQSFDIPASDNDLPMWDVISG